MRNDLRTSLPWLICSALLLWSPTAAAQTVVELTEVECLDGAGVGVTLWRDTLVVASLQSEKLYRDEESGDHVCESLMSPGNISVDGDSLFAISAAAVHLYSEGEWREYAPHPWAPPGVWFWFGEKRGPRIAFATNEPAIYFSSDYGASWDKHLVSGSEYIHAIVLNDHGFFIGLDVGVLVLHPQTGDSIASFSTNDPVRSLAVHEDRIMVIDGHSGVKLYDLNTLTFQETWNPSEFIPMMAQVVNDTLYMAGPYSLHRMESASLTISESWSWEDLLNPLTIARYRDGIYVSSLEGLYRFSVPTTHVEHEETVHDRMDLR